MNENWYQLPPDPNGWQQMIIGNLARKIPEIPKYINSIELTRFDPVMGDAEGMLYLLNGLAGVPIIVRGGRLAPMDVMVTPDEKFYPVTDMFLAKVYADNVIAEPAPRGHNDDAKEGPAYQVKSINTLDHMGSGVKRASDLLQEAPYETKCALRDAIIKNASLVTFFNTHRPEIIADVATAKAPEPEKKAAAQLEWPDLMFLAKEADDRYYFNGEEVSVKEAADFLRTMNVGDDEIIRVQRGGYGCFDNREKHAMAVGIADASQAAAGSNENHDSPNSFAVVLGADNIPYRGVLIRRWDYNTRTPDYLSYRAGVNSSSQQYFFLAKDFYAIQDDILVLERRPIQDFTELIAQSVPSDPAIGRLGVIISKYSVEGPIRVMGAVRAGDYVTVSCVDMQMNEKSYDLDRDRHFYAIPEERKTLMRNPYDSFVAMPGEIVSIGVNPEGRLVYHDKAYSYANILYKLMSTTGIDFHDATKVASEALENGRAIFKLAGEKPKPSKKDDDKPESKKSETKSEHHEKVHRDGSKTIEKNETTTEFGQPEQPEPQPQEQQPPMPLYQPMPVNFDEIEDIAKINDPQLMDTYLSGKLVDVNTAGREQLMQITDDVLEAIKSLGKLLFIIRMGQIDYIKEEDVQMALNKMADIAKAIGVTASQVTPTSPQPGPEGAAAW